ncbi:hypothetical protein [Terriglobus tenax]|uniref:hypothetical protein n=1 Tax=Terriglobus tenax TaxID=1111115 RepID=UPI0021E0F4E4|nr:hypothetical protein [Terriglobus tenax]
MKGNKEEKQKLIAGVIFGVLIVGYLGYFVWDNFLSSPPATAQPKAPVIRDLTPSGASQGPSRPGKTAAPAAKKVGTTAAQLDPTLHMEAMKAAESLEYSGSGRNIFSMSSAPPVVNIPKPVASARPQAQQPAFTAPVGPPPPPPINLRFFGVATRKDGQRQAFLLQGEDVFLAKAGDIVARRYKVMSVNATSAIIVDMTNNNQQTIPLVTQ